MARELLKLNKRGRALVELPVNKGRELIRQIPEPVQVQLGKMSRRSLLITLEIFAGLFVVCSVLLALAYGRLNQGPVSLSSVVPVLEDAINRELDDAQVKIDDAIIRRDREGPGVNFRLQNIRLIDKNGAVTARAPEAAIGLSGRALLRGRIAPGSVDFIGPRLLLYHTEEGGFSLTFSGENPAETGTGAGRDGTTAGQQAPEGVAQGPATLPDARSNINLTKSITEAFDRARRKKTASSYLTRFGVRDAVVIYSQLGKQSFWRVPDFAIDLEHKKRNSIIFGQGAISSANGPWKFNFKTEQSTRANSLTFTALIQDLVPTDLSANLPGLPGLKAIEMPVSAQTSVSLSTSGDLLGADAKVDLAGGKIHVPWDKKHPVHLDSGKLHVRYEAKDERIDILPSRLQWGKSHAVISGSFTPEPSDPAKTVWAFHLKADDAVLGVEDFGIEPARVQKWEAIGTVDKKAGKVVLKKFLIKLEKGQLEFAGTIIDAEGSPEMRLAGNISPMPLNTLLQIWPKFIAAGAREWVGEKVHAGQVTGGSFEIDVKGGELDKLLKGGDISEASVIVDVFGTGLEVTYLPGLPPVQTADATLKLRGRGMEIDAPSGWVVLPSGKKIMVGSGRFSVPDLRPLPEIGHIEFETKADALAMLEILDHKPLGYVTQAGLKPDAFGGKTTGSFKLVLPLMNTLQFSDIKLQGRVDLTEAKSRTALGGAEIQDGQVRFDVNENAINARGDLVVNGVVAKLDWQRIFDAPLEKQPDVRLSTNLDQGERLKLGLDVGHMLRGPMPSVLSIAQYQKPGKPRKINIQADLAGAELVLGNVGWSKPRGRAAILGFDIGQGANGNTELQNFRIIGDDIAIDGWVSLDENKKPREFFFPDFSFNVITHLEVSGKLGADNVWDVRANGPTYDGKQFFRSLFSAGQLTEQPVDQGTTTGNINLTARVGTVVGFFDTTAQDVRVDLKKRGGRLVALDATGKLNGKSVVAARLVNEGQSERLLLAESEDAGSAFRLIGFYPRMEGGQASLKVSLGSGGSTTTGTLWAKDFNVLGDRVVSEVISNAGDDPTATFGRTGGNRGGAQRQRIPFNQMEVPFSVGGGQFLLQDSYINGPQLGATLRGAVDFRNKQVDLGGTFVPLYGLNSALGTIPIVGNLLVGRRGEGVVGITFTVRGPAGNPQVLVNPLSLVTPGIFRQIFQFTGRTPQNYPQQTQTGTTTTTPSVSPFDR